MDCVAVDDVATSVVRIAHARVRGVATSHIGAVQPKHWRECVLWMRLAGYDIELVPYREWMGILRETSGLDNPLQPLRPFFLHTIEAENHLSLPELFEEGRRTHVSDARTREALAMLGHSSQTLTTELLARYFDDYERAGLVPRSPSRPRTRPTNDAELPSLTAALPSITESLAELFDDASIEIANVALRAVKTNDSIVAELTSWRAETRAGLYYADVEIDGRGGKRTVTLFVKSKPVDSQVIDVAESVAALASPALGETVGRFRDHLGFTRSHVRELALYADPDERLRRNTPRVFTVLQNDVAQQWIVVLESIDNADLSVGAEREWSARAIDAAIAGLAQIHASGLNRRSELAAASWQAPLRDERQHREMLPLWSALATHAFEHAPAWTDRRLRRTHERLVGQVASWARALDESPCSLIHNDFNPRNIVVRDGSSGLALCAFDWELATMGVPQRDLAELLAFVLPENASRQTIAQRVEQHRELLQREAGVELDREQWERGFRAALCDLMVDRLASYAMVDRIRAQSFLPRVVRGWNNLFQHYPWIG
jgi:aminoglycoside phosphotransferase (APT) family kinase protein